MLRAATAARISSFNRLLSQRRGERAVKTPVLQKSRQTDSKTALSIKDEL